MRRRNKIFIYVAAVIAVMLVALYLSLFHFGLIEYAVNRELKNRIGTDFPLRVHIGDIGGDYFSRLVLHDINVIYHDSLETYTMASIPQLVLDYSWRRLWRGELIFERVIIDSAVLAMKKSEANEWLVPRPLKESEQKAQLLDFEAQEVLLNNIRLSLLSPRDSLIFQNIVLKAGIEGREKTYSALIEALNFQSSDSRFNLISGTGRITATGDRLTFQDVTIVTDSSNVTVNGQFIIGDALESFLELNASNLNLTEGSSFLGLRLQGDVSMTGTIEYKDNRVSGDVNISGIFMDRSLDSLNTSFLLSGGVLSFDSLSGSVFNGCQFEGNGDVDLSESPEVYHLVGALENFNLNNLVFDSYETNLNGKMNLSGRGFTSKTLRQDIVADLDESWFDEYHGHKIMGFMTITSDSIYFHDQFAVKYHDNTFMASGFIDYSGPVEIEGRTEFKDLSAFNGQTFIERMGGRGKGTFQATGMLSNPDIVGRFESDSVWIYGILSRRAGVEFDIKHFLYDRTGNVDAQLLNGMAYEIPYDTIMLSMSLDSQFVSIDSAFMSNEYADITGFGVLDYLSYPQHLTLDDIQINVMGLHLANSSPVTVDIDSAGYDFISCRLERPIGFIDGSGRVNYDETMDFKVSVDRIDIVPWMRLHSDEYKLSGLLSGEATILGNFESPVIEFEGRVDSLKYQKLILGDLFADFHYSDVKLKIDSVSLTGKSGLYLARGEFPVDLAFTAVEDRIPDAEQDIRITAQDKRLDLASLILYEVEDLTGDFKADFRLFGTPDRPKLDGTIALRNGRLKPYDLVLPLEDMYVDMKMINQTVFIDSISAVCRNKRNVGTLSGKGKIVVNSVEQFDYNVDVTVRDFPAKYELGDISALANADLTIEGMTPPTVFGDVEIISTQYRENFAAENEGWIVLAALEGERTWDLNLTLQAASNLWIKNDDIDAEFAGDLNFIRESGRYRYIGSMEILRGNGYWADRTFRIEPGGRITYDDIEYPNPKLDIYASTKIRVQSVNQARETEAENLDLRVQITGTLDEPIISAAEGSQFTTEDILPLILFNYDRTASGDVATGDLVGDRLTAGLSGYVSSQVGRIGSRTLGVETFEIDPVYGDKFDPLGTRLTLGFYTHPNLYIYGRSAISGEAGQGVGFEYRLKRFLLMEGKADEGDLYQLFLNFYWDY
jgi:hypothetical protein